MRRCYGDSYDAAWVYDAEAIAERLRAGILRSTVGVAADGELVAHVGLVRRLPDDDVAESGQAVVAPEYRGRHLFTLLKQRAAERASRDGLFGLYSEATAAHPYSQRANVALGAVETGLLLGYIPASVEYTAIDARAHRQSVVLFYLKTNDGHSRACTRRRVTARWSSASSNAPGCAAPSPMPPPRRPRPTQSDIARRRPRRPQRPRHHRDAASAMISSPR